MNIEYGERNNSYFLSLVRSHITITVLKLDDNSLVYDTQKIKKELVKYYSGRHSRDTPLNDEDVDDFIQEGPILNNMEQTMCEGEITEAK